MDLKTNGEARWELSNERGRNESNGNQSIDYWGSWLFFLIECLKKNESTSFVSIKTMIMMNLFQACTLLFSISVVPTVGRVKGVRGQSKRELSASVPGCDPGFTNKDDYPAGTAPLGLIEPEPCIPFDDPKVQVYLDNQDRFSYMNYDYRCDTNNCPCGCCRFYTYVIRCDYDNLFLTQPVRDGLSLSTKRKLMVPWLWFSSHDRFFVPFLLVLCCMFLSSLFAKLNSASAMQTQKSGLLLPQSQLPILPQSPRMVIRQITQLPLPLPFVRDCIRNVRQRQTAVPNLIAGSVK